MWGSNAPTPMRRMRRTHLLLRLHKDVPAGDRLHELVELVAVGDALPLRRVLRRVWGRKKRGGGEGVSE